MTEEIKSWIQLGVIVSGLAAVFGALRTQIAHLSQKTEASDLKLSKVVDALHESELRFARLESRVDRIEEDDKDRTGRHRPLAMPAMHTDPK